MKLSNVWHLYRVRLRARWLQECFAIAGIAAGVALLFASQLASTNLLSSAAGLARGVTGHASLQLLARDQQGFPEQLLARVARVPGVEVAAPLMEANANARGPSGGESVELVGVDERLARLGGRIATHTKLQPFAGITAVVLPAGVARTTGVKHFGEELTLQISGHSMSVPLYSQLGARQLGSLSASPIVISSLEGAQELAGMQGHLSRILVRSAAGEEARVRAALERIAGGRLNVEDTGYDERLFRKAAQASGQSMDLFAVISALVGFLFAFNAMLLAVPQRRRLISDLRRDGYSPRAVIVVLGLDALALALIACALGLALGDELSLRLFHSDPGYLSSAFALGSERVVDAKSVLVAIAGGLLASLVAVLSPLRDILSRDPLAATRERTPGGAARAGTRMALAGAACLAGATAILIAAPAAAVLGMILLVLALLCVLPLVLGASVWAVKRLAPLVMSAVPHVSAMELSGARTRSLAVAATGAIAVFGSVSLQGAHNDLLAGLDQAVHDENAFTDAWIAPSGSFNLLNTAAFSPGQAGALARLPGIRAVRIYRGGLLNIGERRVWVIAPPVQSHPLLPSSQILAGELDRAERLVRAGGWVVLSRALAEEHHLKLGDTLVLPSPVPTAMRVAALSTNVGWPPGAMIMNAGDYARAWGSAAASAFNVLLESGFSRTRALAELRASLGRFGGLTVESAVAHGGRQSALSRQGLTRLSQIASLILVGAVLAMAAALGSMVWQRRPALARLRLEGFSREELWGTMLLESAIVLVAGCGSGAVLAVYGQQLLDRALSQVINFPVVPSLAAVPALASLVLVVSAAAAMIAIPGYLAAGVSAEVALED